VPVPLREIPKKQTRAPQEDKTARPEKTLRILYVEDEDENWDVALLHLTRHYQLTRAKTAKETFDLLRQQQFDAILMDIQLAASDMNGIEICQFLRGKFTGTPPPYAHTNDALRQIPIIFVTAYSARYRKEDALTFGGDDLVTKPVNFVPLAGTLIRLVLRSMQK